MRPRFGRSLGSPKPAAISCNSCRPVEVRLQRLRQIGMLLEQRGKWRRHSLLQRRQVTVQDHCQTFPLVGSQMLVGRRFGAQIGTARNPWLLDWVAHLFEFLHRPQPQHPNGAWPAFHALPDLVKRQSLQVAQTRLRRGIPDAAWRAGPPRLPLARGAKPPYWEKAPDRPGSGRR